MRTARLSQPEVLRNVVAEAELADRLGLRFFGVGEHHRADFAVSAPVVVLAAIAGRTHQIRLGSAVTVLSSDDPVRVYQRFATLDAVSNGRAEVIIGRGSFTESFPLFGFALEQYELLFTERLALFAELLKEGPVTQPVHRSAHRNGLPCSWCHAAAERPRWARAVRSCSGATHRFEHGQPPAIGRVPVGKYRGHLLHRSAKRRTERSGACDEG